MSRDGIAERRLSDGGPTPPAPGEVHVWRIEINGRSAARAMLGEILAGYLAEVPPVEVIAEDGGKPRLALTPERLSFNLSHSGGLALVAVAAGDTPVGVDVERIKPRRDLARLAERRLPADDAEAISDAAPGAERERAFYAAWTRHEARVKCTGVGLAGPAPGPEVVAHGLAVGDGYAAAVASRVAEPRIVLRDASCRA